MSRVKLMDGLKVEPVSGICFDEIDLPKFDRWDIKIVDKKSDSDTCQEELDRVEDFFGYKTKIGDIIKLRGKLSIVGSLYNHPDLTDGQNTFTSPITCLEIIGIERFSRYNFDPVTGKISTDSVNSRVYAAITSRHHFFVIDDYGRFQHIHWSDVKPLASLV